MNDPLITIRRAVADDAEGIAHIFDSPRACWGTLQTAYMSIEGRRKRIVEADEHTYPLVAVVDGEVVGQLTFRANPRSRRKHTGDLGMAVRDDWQNKGVGTALMRASLDLADNWLNIHRVGLEVYVDNEWAIHLYQKFGFVIEGRLIDYAFRDGEYVDTFVMGRIRPPRS